MHGDLGILRDTGGGFVPGTIECIVDNVTDPALRHAESPMAGEGFWYLVRAVNCSDKGSYDTGESSQAMPRDDEIAASGNDCQAQ